MSEVVGDLEGLLSKVKAREKLLFESYLKNPSFFINYVDYSRFENGELLVYSRKLFGDYCKEGEE